MKYAGIAFLYIFFIVPATAQQIIGGSMQIERNGLEYTFYVTTYSVNAPNSSGWLNFGDGGVAILDFTSTVFSDSIYENSASAIHIFGLGWWNSAIFQGDMMVDNVNNIDMSGSRIFSMQATANGSYDLGFEYDAPPVYIDDNFNYTLSYPCILEHVESAIDPDGDSIFYSIAAYTVYGGDTTVSWIPAAADYISMDPFTGLFSWSSPPALGLYALEFHTDTYRDGVYMATSVRKTMLPATCFQEVAIDDAEQGQILIYPNPGSTNLHVSTPSNGDNSTLRVFTLHGEQVKQQEMSASDISLNIQTLPPGPYFLQVENNGQRFVTTFVKE